VLDLAVVGGGISGLVAAFTALDEAPGLDVGLFEASDRLGGKLHTISLDGIRIEAGADSFLARDDEVPALCERLGIAGELHAPAVFGAVVWTADGPKRLPPGTVMGVPSSVATALRAQPLSLRGRIRALADLVLPGPLSGPDVAVGPFIRRRFGAEVLDRMVDPILAGTRAGDPDRLSLSECMPQIDRAARSRRSVMSALGSATGPPPFLAPRGGMSRIVEALAARLQGAHVRTNAAVRAIEQQGDGYRLTLGDESLAARSVLFAIPAPAAAPLLAPLARDAARELEGIDHASVAAVSLIYPAGALSLPPGTSGFLVPSAARRTLAAGTWWSIKWPDTGPPDRLVVRAFIGRAGHDPALDEADEGLIERATREIARLVGATATPLDGIVVRWPEGLPQYEVGHAERIERAERALHPLPGLFLAGADYHGTGIPDCVRDGRAAARAAIKSLGGGHLEGNDDGR
jgi:protoporphyrinogen/coproporphyrinogen III oxidase